MNWRWLSKSNSKLNMLYSRMPHSARSIAASVYSYKTSREKYGKYYIEWRKFLDESALWSAEQMRDWQNRALVGYLKRITEGSSYYNSFAHEIYKIADLTDPLSGIVLLPLMNKLIVKERYGEIPIFDGSRRYRFSSSGTTGVSLHVFLTQYAYQREYAFRWKYLSVGGASRGDRFVYFLGNEIMPQASMKGPYYIYDYTQSCAYFSIFHLSLDSIRSYVEEFNRIAPKYIKGYPSAIYSYVRLAKSRGLISRPVTAIYTASEVLHDSHRLEIEEYFSAPIYQWYGQVETTVNIHECTQRRLHVKEEYGYLEILDDAGFPATPGVAGKAYGTGWGNTAFPLVRYDTGDMMVWDKNQSCICGMSGRIIERIIGRDEDVIVTPDGRHFTRLDFIFKPIEGVLESQIAQVETDALEIRVVPTKGFGPEQRSMIEKMIKRYLGNDMRIYIMEVESVPRAKSGKVRYVISELDGRPDVR